MDAPLAVLLRDGTHAGATNRLALKAEQLAVSIQRKPIVQDLPQTSPLIIDLAQNKPGITLSGMIDNVGTDKSVGLSNTDIGFWHMEKMTVSGPNAAGTGVENQTYYVPYKNYLENKIVTVLVENQMKNQEKLFGRTEHMTPVILNGNKKNITNLVSVKINRSNHNSLFGEVEPIKDIKAA